MVWNLIIRISLLLLPFRALAVAAPRDKNVAALQRSPTLRAKLRVK
jgi:hypothetical protein